MKLPKYDLILDGDLGNVRHAKLARQRKPALANNPMFSKAFRHHLTMSLHEMELRQQEKKSQQLCEETERMLKTFAKGLDEVRDSKISKQRCMRRVATQPL